MENNVVQQVDVQTFYIEETQVWSRKVQMQHRLSVLQPDLEVRSRFCLIATMQANISIIY